MWKALRILLLLLILFAVAVHAWLDRVAATSWMRPLWVGVFPISFDRSPAAAGFVTGLRREDFTDIETFFQREGTRYGLSVQQPVRIVLYPVSTHLPPALERSAGPLGIAWWSLKMRWFTARATEVPGRPPPRIRLFVLYHDPVTLQRVPDSHGLQKGLVAVVHAFADRAMAGANNIVIAHELLHTVGATDKYARGSGAPAYPDGFGDPGRSPRYPQARAEIMAGRRALSETEFEMPASLREVVIGPATATEIRWIRH